MWATAPLLSDCGPRSPHHSGGKSPGPTSQCRGTRTDGPEKVGYLSRVTQLGTAWPGAGSRLRAILLPKCAGPTRTPGTQQEPPVSEGPQKALGCPRCPSGWETEGHLASAACPAPSLLPAVLPPLHSSPGSVSLHVPPSSPSSLTKPRPVFKNNPPGRAGRADHRPELAMNMGEGCGMRATGVWGEECRAEWGKVQCVGGSLMPD